MSKVHTRSHEITNKPSRVPASSYYENTSRLATWNRKYNAEKCASEVKNWRIVVNRISKERQTTCNWIKKILDEATRKVNVFLKSWFFYLFLCSISFLVRYDFILQYEAWVNAIRASSFIENFPQISVKPITFQRNLLGKLPRNRLLFNNRFSVKLASKIPVKFWRNRPFFSRICPWKSREIWLFFATYQKPCIKGKPSILSRDKCWQLLCIELSLGYNVFLNSHNNSLTLEIIWSQI